MTAHRNIGFAICSTKYASPAAILNHFFERQNKCFIERTRNDIDCVMANENLFTISILFHFAPSTTTKSKSLWRARTHKHIETFFVHKNDTKENIKMTSIFSSLFTTFTLIALCVHEIYEFVCVCLAVRSYEAVREKAHFCANPIQNKYCIRIGIWYRCDMQHIDGSN